MKTENFSTNYKNLKYEHQDIFVLKNHQITRTFGYNP